MHVQVGCPDGEATFWLEPPLQLARNYRLSREQPERFPLKSRTAAQQANGQHCEEPFLSTAPQVWTSAAILIGVMLFVATVATLHFVQPGYDE